VTELSNLAHGSWEQAEALVGHELLRLEGADEVTAGDFRRKLEAIGFDCALHYDEATAREHGYRSVVSPVSMTRVFALPAYWRPGEPRIGTQPQVPSIAGAKVPGEGDTLIATKVRMEYREPIYPGERVSGVAVLKSVARKTTRVGPGAFLVVETTYTKQTGEVVGVETATLLRYQRRGAS
jgi:N-terminal half of MaoC dehydratase